MPDYELHADFDRNGVLNASPGEYARRQERPGAIVVPNLDADGRSLPANVSTGTVVPLDWQQPTKTGNDNDLLRLRLRVMQPSAPANSQFYLRVVGWMQTRVQLYEQTGRRIPPVPGDFGVFPLALNAPSIDLKLEVRTLPGSPLARMATLSTGAAPSTVNEAELRLSLVCRDPAGQVTEMDWGYATIAPLLLPDNTVSAQRVYICALDDNEPSLQDIRTALAGASNVLLAIIPLEVSMGDGWVQDQFQHGFCEGPAGWMHLVLHLPRLRSNVVQSQAGSNLAVFVASHFPSRNLGLFQDFWQRNLPIQGIDSQMHSLPFEDSHATLLPMQRAEGTQRFLLQVRSMLQPNAPPWPAPGTWFDVHLGLPGLLTNVLQIIQQQKEQAESEDRERVLEHTRNDLKRRVQLVQSSLPLHGGNLLLSLPSDQVEISRSEANRLYERLMQMHHSANYGGNIESSPPVSGAPLGKVVIGNAQLQDGSQVIDPDVRNLLLKQGLQPLVEVDTTWLDVGHVDEVLTFVPDRPRSSFAILRASPGLALQLITAARDRHCEGLPEGHPYKYSYHPSGILNRRTDEGQVPLTMSLRGKLWLHHHPPDALQALEPPYIYRQMADVDSRWMVSVQNIQYWSGEGEDRQYPAGISVHEVLYFESDRHGDSVNAFIEQTFMSEIQELLAQDFPNTPVFKLPVLFDAIGDLASWAEGRRGETTAAFTPNLVNMQVINGRLWIPRPYGPRMRPSDALSVLRQVFQENHLESLASRLNLRYFTNRHLDRTICWIRREAPVYIQASSIGTIRSIFSGIENAEDVARFFRDGFPNLEIEEIQRRIRNTNRREFLANGVLRPGWRRLVIPEGTVDLFEAYTQLIIESLGLQVSWIDSWFYHVRFGEIHCGTNVIRMPAGQGRTRWWAMPTEYTFEEDVIEAQ